MSDATEFMATGYQRYVEAVTAFHQGDVAAWLAAWSTNDPVTVLGAIGADRSGRAELEALMPLVARRFAGIGSTELELIAAEVSGDFAYTVAYERSVYDGQGEPNVLRVTQIYRREDGEWKFVHRHGDLKPVDQTQTSGTWG